MTNFIGEYQIHDSICDKLIEHYHNSDKVEGKVGNYQVNTDIKHSVDVGVDFKSSILIKEYIKELKPEDTNPDKSEEDRLWRI